MKNEAIGKTAVLVVDDTESDLFLLASQLKKKGYHVLAAGSADRAIEILRTVHIDVILSDQVMPETDGVALLAEVRKTHNIPFIMLTSYGSFDKAVISVKLGADDYLTKPCDMEELCARIEKSLEHKRLIREYEELKRYHSDLRGFHNIVTRSPDMLKTLELAAKVAESPCTSVIIYGESGSGKELLARALHCASGCLDSRFVGINCAGIPDTLLESELFGYVRGAFTGADGERKGKLELARNGTLLLDEIGDMPFDLQGKLLRVLEERVYEKLGSDRPEPLNARIIAATHRDMKKLVKQGKFREDLYYRISGYSLRLPPLRDRKEDIPLLAEYFISRFRNELGKSLPGISQSAMTALSAYSWPGNVREMKNCIERAVILSDGELIRPAHLRLGGEPPRTSIAESSDEIRLSMTFDRHRFSLDAVVDRVLEIFLDKCGNNKARAAKLLGVNRKMFYRRKFSQTE